jgi:hypothetical protein
VLVCLFEDQRMPKIKNTVRGCIDGFWGRTAVYGATERALMPRSGT